MSALSDPNEPQLRNVGQLVGEWIVWDDGSPPTPWPSGPDTNTQPAFPDSTSTETDQ
jgi:hypothetical protein